MIIDITKAYLGNIQEGDLFYSIYANSLTKVKEVEFKPNTLVIYFDNNSKYTYKSNERIDESQYKIFREIFI